MFKKVLCVSSDVCSGAIVRLVNPVNGYMYGKIKFVSKSLTAPATITLKKTLSDKADYGEDVKLERSKFTVVGSFSNSGSDIKDHLYVR